MSRWPIRARMTAAFALAMLVVLAGVGLFVYARLGADLDESIDAALRSRADAVAARLDAGQPLAITTGGLEPDEAFAQVLSANGRLLDATGGARVPALSAPQVRAAAARALVVETEIAGIDDTARVLAFAASARRGAPVVAVGQSLEDRNETLGGVLRAFTIGGSVAAALASLAGYLLASAGLAPVEAMRRRADEISLASDELLPLPRADDEIRRLGETLNAMLERLRRAFERERRFVADASHELRTPLAVLKAEIEAAARRGSDDPDVAASLAAALEECDQLVQLTEDLLVLARAQDGDLPVRVEQLDAGDLLEAVRERFSQRARQQQRSIALRAGSELTVTADPLRMRQALGNLVDNALRHGAGTITLGARGDAGGAVQLDVADEGEGFPDELAATAFDRFTRGDAARPRGGAGLGLAIVRGIAQAHGGSAEIAPGEGTVVRISLPGIHGHTTSHDDRSTPVS